MFVISTLDVIVFHYENNYLTTRVAVYVSLNHPFSVVVGNTQRVFSFEDK